MHYVHSEEIQQEHVTKQWVNVAQAHSLEVIQDDYSYLVKVVFSPEEVYFLSSFDCEKAASSYVRDLMNESFK